ncbi:MAG TPA: asparaginase, partial [Actinomycetota bacterium]|nr:asparaginase [Actinomycetota bacterium]
VGGTDRLDTDVMTAAPGTVLAKEGAEGLLCATSIPLGIGIALKVRDGSWRRAAPAFVKVLRDLDVLAGAAPAPLRRHEVLTLSGGESVQGAVEPVVRLRRAR